MKIIEVIAIEMQHHFQSYLTASKLDIQGQMRNLTTYLFISIKQSMLARVHQSI